MTIEIYVVSIFVIEFLYSDGLLSVTFLKLRLKLDILLNPHSPAIIEIL